MPLRGSEIGVKTCRIRHSELGIEHYRYVETWKGTYEKEMRWHVQGLVSKQNIPK